MACIALFSLSFLASCADSPESSHEMEYGPITIDGSTSFVDAFDDLASEYAEVSGSKIESAASGSTNGILRLLHGEVQLARSSRLPEISEIALARAQGRPLIVDSVGLDAVAIIVHPSKASRLREISFADLQAIFFSGKIRSWSELNHSLTGSIHPYVRDSKNSGTAEFFDGLISKSESVSQYISTARFLESNSALIHSVEQDPEGIGYAAVAMLTGKVAALAVVNSEGQGILPTVETIRSSSYPLCREYFLIRQIDSNLRLNGLISYMASSKGKEMLGKHGIISGG